MSSVTYVNAEEVASLLLSPPNKDSTFIILDVRGREEFSEGHIHGAVNLESERWTDNQFVSQIMEEHSDKDCIIVHCHHSQKRGPMCAAKLHDQYAAVSTNDSQKPVM